jgi:hypothetical protein
MHIKLIYFLETCLREVDNISSVNGFEFSSNNLIESNSEIFIYSNSEKTLSFILSIYFRLDTDFGKYLLFFISI